MLIDNILENKFDYCYKSIDEYEAGPWRTNNLRDAIVFKIPWDGIKEAEEFVKGKKIGEFECTYAKAPYENIFLDISKNLGFWVVTKQYSYGYGITLFEFSSFIDHYVNQTTEEVRIWSMYLYQNDARYNIACGLKIRDKEYYDFIVNEIKNHSEPLTHLHYSMHIVIRILTALNCKNVTAIKTHPSKKLNKKRIKRGRLPLLSYYTLKIKDKKSYNSSGLKNLWSSRLHLCRGHFKEYTKESPLFGKYTGLYWWQPHIRGNKKKGVVLKDYEVCN